MIEKMVLFENQKQLEETRDEPVSYTHLDVYKRQLLYCLPIGRAPFFEL